MKHWLKHKLSPPIALLSLCFLIARPGFADPISLNDDIRQLEEDFKNLSSEFYQVTSNDTDTYPQPVIDIEQLSNAVNKLNDAGQSIEAIQLIYENTETIKENPDSDAIFSIITLLLEINDWQLASTLREEVENASDKSVLATVAFLFAKYHARHHEWQQVNTVLEGRFSELSEENTAYAYLLNGTALQHLKKHRQAIDNYDKVPQDSQYYSYSQLNTAIANIRQGWWTDAQTKINNQLKHANKTNTDEFTNRLYLVLGYALLQREYYRDARAAFRHIGLSSRYTNRALLGIGLVATSQGDYVGALNALTILKEKKTTDLSVDESYLLIPYVYEKLQQEITVTSAYSNAVKYYKQRIATLESFSAGHISFDKVDYDEETSLINIQRNSLDYGKYYPESFIKNFQRLKNFQKVINDSKIKFEISELIKKFDKTYNAVIVDLLDERKIYIKSYLNQSRYGLARLYDNSKKADD